MRLRSRLILLVVATAVPLLALAIVACVMLVTNEQSNFIQAVKDRNRAFMTAVDTNLRGHITALMALTALPALDQGNLAAVHEELGAVQRAHPEWIALLLNAPDGTPLLNTRVPLPSTAPVSLEPDQVRRAADTRQPVIGGIVRGRASGAFGIPVRVPVVRQGKTVYVLTAVVRPDAFARLIESQQLPAGWISGIVDAEDLFIARVPPRPLGTPAGAGYRSAVAAADEGWFRGETIEGLDTYTAFIRSPLSGWSVGFAMPASVVLAGAYRVGLTMGAIALGCVLLAMGLAWWLGHHISSPIARLAQSVSSLGTSEATVGTRSSIPEVRELASALAAASDAIRDRDRVADLERKVLAESDRAKDDFIAMLSHEMRNPLAAIAAASSLLRIAAPGSEAASAAQGVIDRQSKQLARLVEDLLDVSRIAMGKAVLHRQPFDLSELVALVVDGWRQAGRLGAHEVTTRLAPAWVNGDRARLEQVVSNLVDNAIKFTPAGGRVEIRVEERNGEVRLVVSDDGMGIPEEERSRVFDLFVQGGQDVSRSHGGIGVGLALVRRLVEMHGGTVTVESAGTGRGSAFSVRLPACAPARPVELAPRIAADASAGSPMRVLLVEDNADGRTMLAALLGAHGHVVREASDARSALEIFGSEAVDVAIVDIGLPDMSGYDLARRLRERSRGRDVRLIALTGYGQPEDKARAIAAGFDHHATKPLTTEDLYVLLQPRTIAS